MKDVSVLNRLMSFSYRDGMKFSWLMTLSTYLTYHILLVTNGFKFKRLDNYNLI